MLVTGFHNNYSYYNFINEHTGHHSNGRAVIPYTGLGVSTSRLGMMQILAEGLADTEWHSRFNLSAGDYF